MNFSGRSVEAAKTRNGNGGRVGGNRRFRLQERRKLGKDLALDVFLFGRRLDHQIAIGERLHGFRRLDAGKRGLALVFGDGLLLDLAGHVAIDGGEAGLDAVGADVVERHVVACERANLGDARAHLARADHSDFFQLGCHLSNPAPFPRSDSTTITFAAPQCR
jgi:hypothetical protein